MAVRLIDAGTVPFVRSQSLYHGLSYAQTCDTPDTIVLATPQSRYMCIGFFQDAAHELNLDFCQENQIPVIRRETGGGAVFIDEGQLFVQWIFQKSILPARSDHRFQLFIKPLVETYKFFGIDAYYHPVNDVHVDGKKITGTGAGTIDDAEVVTGNFLFDFDYNTMADALKLPDEQFRNRVKKYLACYMTTISEELKSPPDREEIKQIYKLKFEEITGLKTEYGELTQHEISVMENLDRKFTTDDWNYQSGIKGISSSDRLIKIHTGVWIGQTELLTETGNIRAMMSMKDNHVQEVSLSGDFNTTCNFDSEEFEQALFNTEITPATLRKKIASYFDRKEKEITGIKTDDWVEVLMKIKRLQHKAAGNGSLDEQSDQY